MTSDVNMGLSLPIVCFRNILVRLKLWINDYYSFFSHGRKIIQVIGLFMIKTMNCHGIAITGVSGSTALVRTSLHE